MPKKSKRKSHSDKALSERWSGKSSEELPEVRKEEEFENVVDMEVDDKESDDEGGEGSFKDKLDLSTIGDLFHMCKRLCGSRKLSVLVYMILRHLGHSWQQVDDLLHTFGAYRCRTAHKWAEVFLTNDLDAFDEEGRGGKHCDSFYDIFPELETEAKAFAIECCSRKSADFTAVDLANFVDKKFYELIQTTKASTVLVRSVESCRLDLRTWGAKFEPNSQRPYFEGHERPDVVTHREQFISHFLQRKDHYYTITNDDQPMWNIPTKKPCVLICKFSFFAQFNRKLIFVCPLF